MRRTAVVHPKFGLRLPALWGRVFALGFLFATIHLLLVVAMFWIFGLGLEGKRHAGHTLLWLLSQPAASLPGAPLALLPLSSAVWGFACAFFFIGASKRRRART